MTKIFRNSSISHARLFITLFVIFLVTGIANGQEIENLLKNTPVKNHDSIYYETFKSYRKSDITLAKTYALKAYHASKHKSGQGLLRVKIITAAGYCYDKTNQRDSAIYFYLKGIELAQQYSLTDRLLYFYNDLGNLYERYDLYDSAIQYYNRALEISKENKKYLDEAIASQNISIVFYHLENYKQALINIEQAIKIKVENNIPDKLADNYLNAGMIYIELGDYDKALENILKSEAVCDGTCDNAFVSDIYYRIGYAHRKKSGMGSALHYYLKAIDLAKSSNNEMVLVYAMLDVGTHKIEEGNLDEGIKELKTVLELSKKISLRRQERDTYEVLALAYRKKGDLTNAIEMQTQFIALKDSIFNEKMVNNVKEFELANQRRLSEEIIDQKNRELTQSKIITGLLIGIVGLIAILFIIIYRNKRREQTQNKVNEVRLKNQIAERTHELQSAVNELKDAYREYDYLIYRTSHDIRGPIATLIGLAQLAGKDNSDPITMLEYFSKIVKTANSLDEKVAQLGEINVVRNKPLEPGLVDMPEIVSDCITSMKHFDHFPLIRTQIECLTPGFTLQVDKWALGFVISKILENSYRYYNPRSNDRYIKITWKQDDFTTTIDIEDNGNGIDSGAKDKLFEIFFVASFEHGTGLGLFLARLASHRIGGKVFNLSLSKPTIFRITLPNKAQSQMWVADNREKDLKVG